MGEKRRYKNSEGDSEKDESTEGNSSVKSYIYILLLVYYLSLLFRHGYACVPNLCMKPLKRVMRI